MASSSPDIQLRLFGDDELKNLLEELPRQIVEKGLRQAATAGGTPITKAYRNDIAVRSGLLKKAIKKKVKLYRDKEVAIALVGVDKNVIGEWKGAKVWPFKYQHLLEEGVQPHSLARGARLRKEVRTDKHGRSVRVQRGNVILSGAKPARIHPGFAGRHYLKHAEEAAQAEALEAATGKLKTVLEAEAEKLAKTK